MKKWISRRNFLKATGISAVAAGLTACGGSSSSTRSSPASGSAAAREDTGLEGHWGGDLVSLKTGEKSSAELTLEHYGC